MKIESHCRLKKKKKKKIMHMQTRKQACAGFQELSLPRANDHRTLSSGKMSALSVQMDLKNIHHYIYCFLISTSLAQPPAHC